MTRIKFYSMHDFSTGAQLKNIEKFIEEYEAQNKNHNINDIIELYNIKQYFDNELYLKGWSQEIVLKYNSIVFSFMPIISKYFNNEINDNFLEIYEGLDWNYKKDFWKLIEKFKIHEKISDQIFHDTIRVTSFRLDELLICEKIVKHHGITIKNYMIAHNNSAELLLNEYEIKHIGAREKLYFPVELNSSDKEAIINNYIDSSGANLNYLRLIEKMQSNKDRVEISTKTLAKAKKRAEEKEKGFLEQSAGLKLELIVTFSESQDEEFIIDSKDRSTSISYSKNWIRENGDHATLLNNFIYLFGIVDMQMRCALVNKEHSMGVLERFLFISSKNAYQTGDAFEYINHLSIMQMAGYYGILFEMGIRLEEIIEWFFHEYLVSEFNAQGFRLTMPSVNSTMLEKCTVIMPAMEHILKQFILYVQDGQIDFELLNIRSEHLIYDDIPSLIDKKYVYGTGDDYNKASFFLFSDQSGLSYCEKSKKSYDNLFELLTAEEMFLDDFLECDKPKINWLVENNFLVINESGQVYKENALLLNIFKDLFYNEVISYWKYSKQARKIIDILEHKKIVFFKSTLFSKPEHDYINFLLNKSKFNNGLDLKNRYSHTQPSDDDNKNYMIFLNLFVLSVIKINDEFCILDELNNDRDDSG